MTVASELITLEMNFADGIGISVVGENHPFVTVFRRASETGKHTGDWILLAVRPSPNAPPRLLGTLVWTPGARFLFFHGIPGQIQSTHPDKSLNGKPLDHITLELDPDMSRFEEHNAALTSDAASRGQARRGIVHPGHLHPWFGLLLRDLDAYETLPRSFKFEFPVPRTDVERRSRALLGRGRRTDTEFRVPTTPGPHYFQVDVWAGRGPGWAKKYADALPWSDLPGVVAEYVDEPVQRAAQIHHFSDDCGLIVVLTRPRGVLEKAGLVHTVITPLNRAG
ncbi:MAG TPA: hypothetical protein VJV79_29935 [Polyangiaceae bacterium]|nr:hypothetical protein [Polyangiaceae bacterium]